MILAMKFISRFGLILILFVQANCFAQDEGYRPDLLFREDWKEIPAEIPLYQKHVENPNLKVSLFGPGVQPEES
jgi:hypothetical protein